MKMNHYRLFLLSFVTASLVLLTGFEKPGVNNAPPPAKKQTVSTKVKEVQSKSKDGPFKSKQKKTKNQRSVPSAKNDATEDAELQKYLDLSIPFKDSENAGLKIEQNRAAPEESLNMFAAERKKKPRPVYLDSQMLMSQEPEVDKQKSLDGAGIVINLKR